LVAIDAVRRAIARAPLKEAVHALCAGQIVAIKSAGGFHLACNAYDEIAVRELRRRKGSERQPLAVMVADVDAAKLLCVLDAAGVAALSSSVRPIVVAKARPGTEIAPSVALSLGTLGVMLPSTPLHTLLLDAFGAGALVMTSGNRSGDTSVYEDAFARLFDIADVFLSQDSSLAPRCEDSVVRSIGGVTVPLRMARGLAHVALPLPRPLAQTTLAVGCGLVSSFALGDLDRAFLGRRPGDEAHPPPERLIHDLHPDSSGTRWALERAASEQLPAIAVQHHHAHMASCMAENGVAGPAIGVVFDGVGYGYDGSLWGGEFFVGGCRAATRVGHLAPVPIAGGQRAANEPWRVALAWLLQSSLPIDVVRSRVPERSVRAVVRMIEGGFQVPSTSSAACLVDAVAWLLGGPDRLAFSGHAAFGLESTAALSPACGAYPFEVAEARDGALVVDVRPTFRALIEELTQGAARAQVARRFHSTLAEAIATVCARIREDTGLTDVVLSGAVFQNALLAMETSDRLTGLGFTPHRHRRLPPNDGGLSFGQLAVAAALDIEL